MKNVFKTVAMAAIAALALTGCIKHEPYGHRPDVYPDDGGSGHGGGGGGNSEKVIVKERTDWSIRYLTREDWVNDDGTVDKAEHFTFAYNGNGYFIVRLVRPDDFRDAYNSDAAAFFTYEADALVEDAKNDGVNFWDYTLEVFTSKIKDVYFNRLRSGTWTAFMIELDEQGKVTGNYAETNFTIQEEVATEAFSKWLGTWRTTSNNTAAQGVMGYDITISSLDNNYLYRIDGWECGMAVSFQMDQEYLEGEFYEPNGFLYIRSQFLGSYEDTDFNHGDVDELFMGNIYDSNGLTLITDEGIDIAVMVPMDWENGAELQPMDVTIQTADGDYDTKFYSIQYYMWAHSDGNWYPYNANAGRNALPHAMAHLQRTRAENVHYAKERTATKASIHHMQPKAGQSARNSVAKKTVRMK